MANEYFNLTNVTGSDNMLDVVLAVNNDLVGGTFGIFFLIGIWIIMFVSFKTRYFAKQSFAAASFITMIMTFMFSAIGLVPDLMIFISIAMTVFGIVFLIISNE